MMIADFHSHVLPGVDDGSRSLEESIAMLRLEAEQGIEQVIATPHFYPSRHRPETFLEKRRQAEEQLREAMARNEGLPRLLTGAEVYFFSGMSESDFLQQLTIDSKRCILLEMPVCRWTESMYREMENIRIRQGLIPIIAHVDRYIKPLRTGGIPEKLAQLPVLVQANASFFLRRSTRGMALRMLRNDQIHLLGSDCHDLIRRPPNLGTAAELIQAHLGMSALEQIESLQQSLFEEEKF